MGETEALQRYFNDNYQALMTLEERQSLDLSWYRLAARQSRTKAIAKALRTWLGRLFGRSPATDERAGEIDDEDFGEILQRLLETSTETVKRLSLAQPPAIYQQIDDRLRRDYEDGTLHVNRCPKCQRIVRTPVARQCLWCGHDWHTA